MKKTLVTFISTGSGKQSKGTPDYEYRMSRYIYPDGSGKIAESTPFSFQAIAESVGPDEIMIFGTKNSMWSTLYLHYFNSAGSSIDENDEAHEFFIDLDDKVKGGGVGPDDLARLEGWLNGISEVKYSLYQHEMLLDGKAMWEYYGFLAESVKDAGRLYLDITHGFRHIPLLAFTACTFITTMYPSQVEITGIYSAVWEAKKTDDEEEPAPLIDLIPAFEMVQWFHAGRDMLKYGDYRDFSELISELDMPLSGKITAIGQALQVSAVRKIDKKANNVLKKLEKEENIGHDALKQIRPLLEQQFAPLVGNDSEWEMQYQVAKWYIQHEMYQQAVTTLQETMLTMFLEEEGYDTHQAKFREIHLKDNEWLMKKYKKYIRGKGLKEKHKALKKIRNSMNHGWMIDGKKTDNVKATIDEIHIIFNYFNEVLN